MHGLQGQGPCHFENILQAENNLQLIVVQNLANVQSWGVSTVSCIVSYSLVEEVRLSQFQTRVPGIQTDMDPSWIPPSCCITPPTIPVTMATATATHTCIIPTFPPSPMPLLQPSPRLSPGPKKRPLSQNQAERDMQEELKREKNRLAVKVWDTWHVVHAGLLCAPSIVFTELIDLLCARWSVVCTTYCVYWADRSAVCTLVCCVHAGLLCSVHWPIVC